MVSYSEYWVLLVGETCRDFKQEMSGFYFAHKFLPDFAKIGDHLHPAKFPAIQY